MIKRPHAMKERPAIPKGGNDRIMTPPSLATAIVEHFNPDGYSVLEPCQGDGAFTKALDQHGIKLVFACEIDHGSDFLTWEAPVDWIVTNPPWSKFLAFLKHSMAVAHDVVFLAYANAWFVKSRINAMQAAGFHFREFAYVANPKKPWPQMGLQLAAVHISRTAGDCKFTRIDWSPDA
jgi:hypothetical protein